MHLKLRRFAPVPLRLMLGAAFLYHGIPKLFTAEGHEAFAGMLQGVVPAPGTAAWLIGCLECAGGLALLAGVWTTAFCVLLGIEMAVAALAVHGPAGFNFLHIVGQSETGPVFGMPGYEVNLLYIAALGSLLLSGPGAWSLGGRHRPHGKHAPMDTSEEGTQTVIRAEPEGVPIDVDRQAL